MGCNIHINIGSFVITNESHYCKMLVIGETGCGVGGSFVLSVRLNFPVGLKLFHKMKSVLKK